MPDILWTQNFLEAQGFPVTETILHQDNESCILLAKNGRQSSSKRTKHINLRYFYVKDMIDSGDIVLRYCNTDNMHADFFTKALQGNQFRKHRDYIMNVDPAYYYADHRSVLRYCGQTNKAEQTDTVKADRLTASGDVQGDVEDPTPYRTALLKQNRK
jgi:hypothetical protein